MQNKYLIKFVKIGIDLTLFVAIGAILVFLSVYLYVGPQLPPVDTLKDIRLQTPMSVYSSDEKLFATFGEKKRIPVAFDQIPELLNQALIATEDRRFYSHGGVDGIGLARAVFQLLSTGRIGGGGSTITMQLARNFFLSFDQTFTRKAKEIFLSWKIERALTKQDILTLYWNRINFSHRAYGVGAAAQVYYGVGVDQLTLPQLAIIAGIPKGPSTHNPISRPEKAFKRRNHVLNRMFKEGYIDQATMAEAIETPLSASIYGARVELSAPYFAESIRREMIKRFGTDKAYTAGYKVYTTLDSQLQVVAKNSLRSSLIEYDRRHGYRGSEQHFDEAEQLILNINKAKVDNDAINQTPLAELSTNQNTNEPDFNLSSIDLISFDKILDDIPVIGDLSPSLVLAIEENSIQVLIKKSKTITELKDRLITIHWEGLSWARPFINDSRRGKAPRTASQIVATGDLIRIFKDPTNHWQLSQIPEVSAAFVSLNPNDGAVTSLVGGFDFNFNKFNNVYQARRQPGSNIKPFIYSAAFEKGYTTATVVNDAPFTKVDASSENIWRPKNSSGRYKGPTRLRNALKSSTNLVSIRLLNEIGAKYAVNYLASLGFDRQRMRAVNSLALGAADFTPLEVATGFAIFANGGYRVEPYIIQRIEDSNGNILFEAQPITVCKECEKFLKERSQRLESESHSKALISDLSQISMPQSQLQLPSQSHSQSQRRSEAEQSLLAEIESEQQDNLSQLEPLVDDLLELEPSMPIDEDKIAKRVIPEDNVYLIDSMMKDVIHSGTAAPTLRASNSPLLRRNDIAGKTGTTNQAKDAWFSGYNSDYIATAWVGFSDYSRGLGANEFGGKAALPIWQSFMEIALKGRPQHSLDQPQGIVTAKIDPATGLLAPATMDGAIFEIFRERYLPEPMTNTKTTDPFNEKQADDEESIF